MKIFLLPLPQDAEKEDDEGRRRFMRAGTVSAGADPYPYRVNQRGEVNMPTGYTAGVQDGTVTDFNTFLLRCARAFGALVEMRDDAMDAPIPEKFAPSSYHTEALAKAKADLERFRSMPIQKVKREAAAEYAAAMEAKLASEVRRKRDEERYQAMLAKVRGWTPPSTDHDGLKRFMVEQLTDSIRFDCSGLDWNVEQLAPEDWLAKKIETAKRDVQYHAKHLAEDIQRAEERTRWVQQLRDSVGDHARLATR